MKVYTTKSKYNCGPCSFINLTGVDGNKKIEKDLAEKGKLKPFQASSYTSFLVWSKKYNKKLIIYTSSKKLNNKIFDFMIRYEKIPKKLQEKYKNLASKRFEKLNKQSSSKVRGLKSPIKKLDSLLKKGYKVVVLASSFYLGKERTAPHWIVAFKKEKSKYYFMCSQKGIIILSKKDLLKGFKLNKKVGYYPVLVSYKNDKNIGTW